MDPRTNFQKRRGWGLGFFLPMVLWFLCKFARFLLSSQPRIPRGLAQGGVAFEGHVMSVSLPCRAVAAYICPLRNSFLKRKSHLKMAGESFNFLHIVHPRQLSLVFALKELLFSHGRNLRKWKPQVFLLASAPPTLCNTEVFCSLEHEGYEKSFGLYSLGISGPVVMTTVSSGHLL